MACGIILRKEGDRHLSFDPEHHDLYFWHKAHDSRYRIYRAGNGIPEDCFKKWKCRKDDTCYQLKSSHNSNKFKTIISNILDSRDVNYCLDNLIHSYLGKDTEYMKKLNYIRGSDNTREDDVDQLLDNAERLISEFEDGTCKDSKCSVDSLRFKLDRERSDIYEQLFDKIPYNFVDLYQKD